MASNHGNLQKYCYLPWIYRALQGSCRGERRGGVKKGRLGTGKETGTEGAGRRGRNVGGNGEKGRWARAGGAGEN